MLWMLNRCSIGFKENKAEITNKRKMKILFAPEAVQFGGGGALNYWMLPGTVELQLERERERERERGEW